MVFARTIHIVVELYQQQATCHPIEVHFRGCSAACQHEQAQGTDRGAGAHVRGPHAAARELAGERRPASPEAAAALLERRRKRQAAALMAGTPEVGATANSRGA